MGSVDLGRLLPEFAGAHLLGFVLVLVRVGTLFLLAPVFSTRLIPVRAKLIAAGAIAFALAPAATRGQTISTDPLLFAELVLKEVVVGLGFAFVIGAIGAAVQSGASLLDTLIGFSFASLVDPVTNMQNAILGQLYAFFTAMVFIVTGGDQVMVLGLGRSYQLVPLSRFPDPGALAPGAAQAVVDVFTIGLEIVAPAVVALLVADAAFAVVARAVPQVNVFVVGLPAKILLGFATIGASLPFVAAHLRDGLGNAVLNGLAALGGH